MNRGPQKGTLIYYVFDLMKLGNLDFRGESRERKEKLKRLVKNQSRLLFFDHMEREGLTMFAGALALRLEGVVAKDAKSPSRRQLRTG